MMYIENIEQALEYMEEAIRHKIRRIDVCTRYSAMQYLIILFESDESQIPKVMTVFSFSIINCTINGISFRSMNIFR